MEKIKSYFLNESYKKNFYNLEKEEKKSLVRSQKVVLYSKESNNIKHIVSVFEENGFYIANSREVILALANLIIDQKIEISFSKKNKFIRGELISNLLKKIDVFPCKNNSCLFSIEGLPLSQLIANSSPETKQLSDSLFKDNMVFGKVINFINESVNGDFPVVIETQSSNQFKNDGPRISINENLNNESNVTKKNIDKAVDSEKSFCLPILREMYHFASLKKQREKIEELVKNEEIITTPKFKLENWPKDHLMQHIRRCVDKYLVNFEKRVNYFGDTNDLKYQILFRLTSYPVHELFDGGYELEACMRDSGTFKNWRNIFEIDVEFIKKFNISENLLEFVANEQLEIINIRLRNSELPLDEILLRRGIFAEQGWVIHKKDGKLYVVQEKGVVNDTPTINLSFKEIDVNLARKFHNDLHYIHTPRADMAFGLFVDGENLPFSILALERIDRSYKQNALLYQGYDPDKCFDLTRLYSKPGTPGNTSSSMFSLVFKYLKQNYKDTQAILSSFMPSYATGVSMTSGGFNNPILIKPNKHSFAPTKINDKIYYENVTKRRQKGGGENLIYSKIPLLPTVELMSSLQSPRFEPISGYNKYMLEVI